MLDSNTINPQTDKLHRFLVVPSGHKMNYNVGTNSKDGIEFHVDGVENERDSDQSYVVRMALAQAFGQSVDKMDAYDIIDFGNAVLSLNKEQLAEAKKQLLSSGKITINVNGKAISLDSKNEDSKGISDADVSTHKGEAEHLTHTLQALDFLNNVQDAIAKDGSGKMSSSLSLEFDSLTSGFANKIQQMPILENMKEHFARTGVLTVEYQEWLKDQLGFKGETVGFNPAEGHAVSDLIATDIFEDSYVSMAKVTIARLVQGDKQDENLSTVAKGNRSGEAVFNTIKLMLPGGDAIDSGNAAAEITSIIRNLFKNPFMIFNYSAGIGRIIKNLSFDVGHSITKNIAKADMSDPENATVLATAQNMINNFGLLDPSNDKPIKNVAQLQEVLRNYNLKKVKLSKSITVGISKPGKSKAKASFDLESLLIETVSLTYGEVVKDVFTDTFGPFVKTQEAMNDAFKLSFRIFDKKRVDMLNKIQKEKPDHFLNVDDYATVLEELWDDFPWILGPLTDRDPKKKLNKKDIIAVFSTNTATPNNVLQSRKNPQAVLSGKQENGTRTVSPLIRQIEEAISAGSVLPFHAIDGAEISTLFDSMFVAFGDASDSMAAIHDAVIPPINFSDHAGYFYNSGMSKTNTDYVLADALDNMVKRLSKTVEKEDFSKNYKDLSVKGFKVTEENEDIKFADAAKYVVKGLQERVDSINEARKEWYGDGTVKGKLDGAMIGNLVGTPGGVFIVGSGSTAPDLSYKDKFKESYAKVNVDIKEAVKEAPVPTPTRNIDDRFANSTIENVIVKMLGMKPISNKEAREQAITDSLLNEPEKVQGIIDHFTDKLNKTSESKTGLIGNLNEVIDNLTIMLPAETEVNNKPSSTDINESTTNADNNSILSNTILENTKGCTK